jgi:hypothetical protein
VKINGSVLIANGSDSTIPAKNSRVHTALLWREDWEQAMEGNELGQQTEGMEWKGRWGADGVDWRFVGFLIIYSMGPT